MSMIPRSEKGGSALAHGATALLIGYLVASGTSVMAAPGDALITQAPTLAGSRFQLPEDISAARSPVANTATIAASSATVTASSIKGFGRALSSTDLDRYRGGAEVLNAMALNGVVADNSANRIVTGSNAISAGAFTGFSGFGSVIQNSGANVLIQNATILNVEFK